MAGTAAPGLSLPFAVTNLNFFVSFTPNVTVLGVTSSGGVCMGGANMFTCCIASLPAGTPFVITADILVVTPGSIGIFASATATGPDGSPSALAGAHSRALQAA
jgi:hypothetical protein